MKQFVYLIVILVIIGGCSNIARNNMEPTANRGGDDFVTEEASFAALEDAYAVLVSEKLQDYLDKQLLAKQHPEFINRVDDIKLFHVKDAKEILQIKFIGKPEVLSDSITKIITQVHFSNTKTDTIISYIKTSSTTIDGVKFKTSKAMFEKIKSSKKID
ncbi:hypothetical protein D1818_19035 [Aquimarina sp. BL5]|uniref:hypothetical protein n=1 Tax=Aquimarina sp. BL5 TaxID=1714860 RepID=UPI000E533D37|nr:hypothetical protein [Aquimarina sp. BL5]AXT52814.1 hypothetical protein D1818_19035 [Aquimarina sp. BL5]RKN07750.1 hypothetical protein D7036_07015 [Aquimarina sp. BL5]